MKLRLTLLISLLSFNLTGQIYTPSDVKQYESLTGDVYLLSIFIDTDEDEWLDAEMEHFYQSLEQSKDWIIDQAASYQKEVNFIDKYFIENQERIYIKSVSRKMNRRLLQRQIFIELGYESFRDFLKKNNFDFNKEKFKLLLFVKSRDRSHAYNAWSNADLDLAIVYCQTSLGRDTHYYTIAHELLHQFGAWDLYKSRSIDTKLANKAIQLFPNSIMISTLPSNDSLGVDKLTAWRIGWNEVFQEEYLEFKPQKKEWMR